MVEKQSFSFELDSPQKAGPESYLTSVLFTAGKIDEALLNMNGVTDRRPYYLARQLIARIPNDTVRYDLFKKLDAELAAIREEIRNNEEQARATMELISFFTGEVMAYFDAFIGVEKVQIVGEL